MWILGQLPLVGGFIGLIDALLIFREEKNCLHDDLAGTRVILLRDLPEGPIRGPGRGPLMVNLTDVPIARPGRID